MLDTLIVEDPQSCVGLEVLLQDLVGRAELNGRSGIAVSFDTKTCRLEIVGVTETRLAVKPTNLSLTKLMSY